MDGTRTGPAMPIRDLGVIGDQRSAAVVARDGTILWYCADRFDRPSLLAGLLDPEGGNWRVELAGAVPLDRRYLDTSTVLETRLRAPGGDWLLTDWMNSGPDASGGILCRAFGAPPSEARIVLRPRPDYARRRPQLTLQGDAVVIDGAMMLQGSHPLEIDGDDVAMRLPQGEPGWAVLSDMIIERPEDSQIARWRDATLQHWHGLAQGIEYCGVYRDEVAQSLRAIRMCSHEESGGIVAAVTTSLPEVPGGDRNWDYRYVWLRDAGMIVSALLRMKDTNREGRRYLDFICKSSDTSDKYPMAVFTTLDGSIAPGEEMLEMTGWSDSRPVRVGNGAGEQLQHDAFANVVLAAKLLYREIDAGERPYWSIIEEISEFLVKNWHEPDHGIWEETPKLHYTSSKVVAACALESAAEHAEAGQAARWTAAAAEIRDWVARHCLTPEGAYAVAAGRDEVDVSAALFPVWAYCDADSPEMLATIAALERDWSPDGLLYWRRLECADGRAEGVFIAATFWVAQYWVMRGDLDRTRAIIDAALAQANDLGLFAEEADPRSGDMLGNLPQAFAHAAFIGAVIDLDAALNAKAGSA